METLASIWACDPSDLNNWRQTTPWESSCVCSASPPAGEKWTQQLSPHLQRNKQLQDTLLQREEELARLQDENNQLREFLNSSFVRNLEQKAKRLTADGRRKLKRNTNHDPFKNCHHQLLSPQQARKKICRNLTAEFCSESSETSSSSEPNLDLWVLQTLGLKDLDTIDSSNDDTSSPGCSLSGFHSHSVAVTSSSSSEPILNSSVHYCQRLTHETDCGSSPVNCREANCGNPAKSPQNCTTCPNQCSDLAAAGPTVPCEATEAVIRSYDKFNVFQSPPLTEEPALSQDTTEICSRTILTQVQTPEGHQTKHPAYWSLLRGAPSQDKIHLSPQGERLPFSPVLSSSPVMSQQWTPLCSGGPLSPSVASENPTMPRMPCSRTDLAFSMSLSPASSVKTHSFPQGQAFIAKDPDGRWNFTWVPRQGP